MALHTTALPLSPALTRHGVTAAWAYSVDLTTRFRGITTREGVLLAGPGGWGEFSPFWDYPPAECVPWWRAALAAARGELAPATHAQVPVNVTIPAVPAAAVEQIAAAHPGVTAAKVKVAEPGHRLADECARLAAVRAALPAADIRIDANGAWSVDEALDKLPPLQAAAGGLAYVEQPCRTVAELAAVRAAGICPVAADESIRRAADPHAVARAQAADYIVIKAQPLGGSLAAAALAAAVGLPAVVSSALETSVGLAQGYALACALADAEGLSSPRPAGLGTRSLLTGDVVEVPLAPRAGALHRADLPTSAQVSVGVERAARLDADLAARWSQRLAAVLAVGGQAAAASGNFPS
ncbi:O-succinylbenzoate synthase [Buchananella hordeovulneris]|uniref:o-succinylbenzoate synthase n=1 Tax=Buchananella hordeovulneris TaxID=52770 RepID=UPI000F600E92|nr:o-succinylbenzoate synthase [Buchananella hordeovulneris]RRD51948.1 O-succinylbenzoate synthase [Buchananella hordeovulneris]